MKQLLTSAALLVLTAAVPFLPAQEPTRHYSDPALPPREVLDRLRLKTAWSAMLPTDGRRDGFYTVQMVPRGTGHELLVQMRSGAIMSLDANTGRVRWSTRVGTAYRVAQPLAYNRESVFVINNIVVFALDRDTGRLQWQFDMPQGATARPIADDEQLYLALSNGRLTIYGLPNLALAAQLAKEGKVPGSMTTPESARSRKGIDVPAIGPLSGARESYRGVPSGPQPTERGAFPTEDKIEGAPLQTQDRVLLPGAGGEITGLAKAAARPAWKPVRTRGKIAVPAGQHDETAYVASTDYNIYAVNIGGGQLLWRSALGGIATDRPAALDDEVYVTLEGSHLARLSRADGEESWRNEDAARFLAANKKAGFTYATDRHGRLVVIDRDRGTTLSTYDGTRDFVFPIQNDWTDRLYLAANNGLIVCLRDRDSDTPVVMKKPPKERTTLPPGKPGKEPPGKEPPPKPKEGDGGKPKAPADGMKP